VDINGADQLARLAKALKEAGAKDLQRELSKGLNRAVKPLKAEIKQSAADNLPKRGGLAASIAASKLSTRRPNNKKGSGLRIVAKGPYSLYHLDQGIVRHGKGKKTQAIAPGWWTNPTEASAPEVRREVEAAMAEVAKKIDRAP
jgi:hypothetical protein